MSQREISLFASEEPGTPGTLVGNISEAGVHTMSVIMHSTVRSQNGSIPRWTHHVSITARSFGPVVRTALGVILDMSIRKILWHP